MTGVTGLCSCAIGRRTFRGIGGTGDTGEVWVEDGALPNIERTLSMVFRRDGALPLVVEGEAGGLRRKSVRMSLLGCGSEMFPKDEPERRRDSLRRRAPRRQMLASVRTTPRKSPGKKPTRIAGMGNLLHSVVRVVDVFMEDAGDVDVGFEEVAEEGAEEEDAPGTTVWSAFITQFPLELQLKPNGQHSVPQLGRVAERAVVLRVLSGNAATFCNVMLQGIGLIVLQSVLGQQRRVVLPASGMQAWPAGQQKFEGRPD